jgi:DHA1 family multidrug resistance protein-like MFS transporter
MLTGSWRRSFLLRSLTAFVRWPTRPTLSIPGLTGQRRETLIWICVLIAVNQFGFGAIVPVAALYADSFGVSEAAVGLTIAVYGLARFVVSVPAGRIADHFGRRPLLALGGIITVVGNALCALVPDYTLFLMARFVAGAGASMVLSGGQAVIADISEPATRGRTMGIYMGVFLFAVGIGPVPGGYLATEFGLTAPFVANAVLASAVALLAWFRVPETRDLQVDTSGQRPAPVTLLGQLQMLRSIPALGLISVVSFAVFFCRTGALFNVVPIDAERRLGLGPAQIGIALGMVSIIGLLLAYPSGALVDRFGRKVVISPSTFLTGAALILFAIVPTWEWFLGASVVWAMSSGISGAAQGAYAADVAPAGRVATALGTYRMVGEAGYVAGPLTLGFLSDLGSPQLAFVFAALLVAGAGLLFALLAPETLTTRTVPSPAPQPEHSPP